MKPVLILVGLLMVGVSWIDASMFKATEVYKLNPIGSIGTCMVIGFVGFMFIGIGVLGRKP